MGSSPGPGPPSWKSALGAPPVWAWASPVRAQDLTSPDPGPSDPCRPRSPSVPAPHQSGSGTSRPLSSRKSLCSSVSTIASFSFSFMPRSMNGLSRQHQLPATRSTNASNDALSTPSSKPPNRRMGLCNTSSGSSLYFCNAPTRSFCFMSFGTVVVRTPEPSMTRWDAWQPPPPPPHGCSPGRTCSCALSVDSGKLGLDSSECSRKRNGCLPSLPSILAP
mmetsp:Transcript_5636/g.17129  ORF Transcript_5636/g.17129 Transcript_5636/m.17129 type:complete len:220 (+) Transcript_5636:283-942(+)